MIPDNCPFRPALASVLFLLVFAAVSRPQTPQEPTPLVVGTPLEREIEGGQKHLYIMTLAAGRFVRIKVLQLGADVVVKVLDTAGADAEYDIDPREVGEEPVETTSGAGGEYRLSVETRQRNTKGKYRILLTEIRAASRSEMAVDESRRLLTEANRLWRAGDYSAAQPYAERALAIREKELGPDHFAVSQALVILANIRSDNGEFEASEGLYLRSISIREKLRGRDDFTLTPLLNNLGALYKDRGEYRKARELFERTLKIREASLGPDHLLIASVLVNLGSVIKDLGDTDGAARAYTRALEIREKALGPESAEAALVLSNLGNLYRDPERAEKYYLRVLAIREKLLGADHAEVGQTLYNLAVTYSGAGDFAKALPLAERSLAIFEKRLGPSHPLTSFPLNLLGIIYKNTGEYQRAENVYLRSIDIKERSQGRFHPYLGGVFANLAGLYILTGDIPKALAAQSKANTIFEYNVALNLVVGSESEKFSYLRTLADYESRTLSLHTQNAPDSEAAAELAATTILQRKGRVLDALSDDLASLRRRFGDEDRLLLDRFNKTTASLVGLVIGGSGGDSADFESKVRELEIERERLESEISRRSAGFYEQSRPVTIDAVRAAIPADAALVEIAVYRTISPKASEFSLENPDSSDFGPPRYAAYVIRRDGKIGWADLGDAGPIDAATNAFRRALRDPKSTDFRARGRDLYRLVMQPVRQFAGKSAHLLISPDGLLNLVPFEAMVDENDRFLVESFVISYLTSGRDLLRLGIDRKERSSPIVFANPTFGPSKPSKTGNRKVRSGLGRALDETFFAPLAATDLEARSIASIFSDARVLSGSGATESALKQIAAPSVLHIATHGFFLGDDSVAGADRRTSNPLLRAGLAFAGANRRADGSDDGILTGLEASGLNLWGTKLVVLSACDTGVGEVRNGEGVYGLRRAFILAGTETLVMSLWPISDLVTRDLMSGYYRRLKSGSGRIAALRAVQLEMLANPKRAHPFYWAAFIGTGEWGNLAGER